MQREESKKPFQGLQLANHSVSVFSRLPWLLRWPQNWTRDSSGPMWACDIIIIILPRVVWAATFFSWFDSLWHIHLHTNLTVGEIAFQNTTERFRWSHIFHNILFRGNACPSHSSTHSLLLPNYLKLYQKCTRLVEGHFNYDARVPKKAKSHDGFRINYQLTDFHALSSIHD